MKREAIFGTVLMVITAVLLLAGCGTNDRYTASDTDEASAQGMMQCYQCHNDTDNPGNVPGVDPEGTDIVFGNSPASVGWLNSPHANNESIDASHNEIDLFPDNIGFPDYGYLADCTTKCHDQLGDGRLIDDYAAETGDESLGRVERPVIGCESCHGSGNGHMAEAVPGPSACGQCHSSEFDHNYYHPEGDNIIEDYRTSPHANSTNVYGISTCSRCHTNQGAQAYIDIVNGTESLTDIALALSGEVDIEDPTAVQCATCHEAHTLELLGELNDDLNGTGWSAEFRTCTACHQLYDAAGNLNSAFHEGWGSGVVITDTHYDDPLTDTVIEGYIINATSTRADDKGTCLDCHNPHNADTTINRQWARSGHGGRLLGTVDPVTGIGNVTEAETPAWVHYDFKDKSSYSFCQRCHTATGFRNFASAPALYNAADNTFTATGQQREMLYCWACHTSNVGDLRNPGIFNDISPYTEPASRIAAVPDIEGSNVCLSCHSGLSSGQGIKDADYATEISGKNFGSFNSHYLAAGGIMFRTIGYEFANSVGGAPLNYDDASYYGHKNIGTANCESHGHPCSEDVRSGGPCVGCHMKDADSGHTLHVVEKDTGGIITGILANDGVCSNCHAGPYTLTATELEEQAEGFHEGLVVLEDALIANGIYYQTCYPYFYNTSPANCGPYYPSYPTPNPDVFTAWPDKQSLGAAFNFSMLHHEPGAYAHNRFYTQRLVFDSIDWLDGDTRLDDLGNFGTDGERMDGYIDLTGHTHAYDWLRGYGYPAITNVPRP